MAGDICTRRTLPCTRYQKISLARYEQFEARTGSDYCVAYEFRPANMPAKQRWRSAKWNILAMLCRACRLCNVHELAANAIMYQPEPGGCGE